MATKKSGGVSNSVEQYPTMIQYREALVSKKLDSTDVAAELEAANPSQLETVSSIIIVPPL